MHCMSSHTQGSFWGSKSGFGKTVPKKHERASGLPGSALGVVIAEKRDREDWPQLVQDSAKFKGRGRKVYRL